MTRTDESLQSKVALIAEECIAVSLRLLTRAVTKIYNHALRPHGLTVGQMNILVAASLMGPARQQDICRVLFLEKSTLSRDLTRMRERGWIAESPGDDARSSLISVTALATRRLCVLNWKVAKLWCRNSRQAPSNFFWPDRLYIQQFALKEIHYDAAV